MTNDQIRLHFGELTAAEMRLARAIVGWYERQIAELKRWKAEAQTVEAEWNPQELAKLLGASLGQSCRQVIQKRVPEILAENAKLRVALTKASTSLSAFLGFHAEALPLEAVRRLSELVSEIQPLIKP